MQQPYINNTAKQNIQVQRHTDTPIQIYIKHKHHATTMYKKDIKTIQKKRTKTLKNTYTNT